MSASIPSDLDQLMWLLAESGDYAAIDEFTKRFPDLRHELNRRCATVNGLKGAKPGHGPKKTPEFHLVEIAPRKAPNPLAWIGGVVALVCIAFASYQATSQAMKPKESPPVATGDKVLNVGPTYTRKDREEPNSLAPGAEVPPTKQRDETDVQPLRTPIPKYEMPHSVYVEEQSLFVALEQIAQQTGMEIEVAPKTENPTITVSFEQISGPQMLEQLGKAYGFTPLHQGEGRYLIIPAIQWTDPR